MPILAPAAKRVGTAVRSAAAWNYFYGATEALARGALAFLAAGLLTLAVDWVIPMSQGTRQTLWIAAIVLAAAAAATAAWPLARWRKTWAARRAGAGFAPSDALVNAWDLLQRPPPPERMSPELVARSVEDVAERLGQMSLARALQPRRWREWMRGLGLAGIFAGAAVLLLPVGGRAALARVFTPFGAENIAGLTVTPGDFRFPVGESVPVEAKLEPAGGPGPELWVQTSAFQWEKRAWESAGARSRYVFNNLLEPLSYKVRHRGRWTPVYTLKPYRPPRFETLTAELDYPAYTKKPTEKLENALSLRVLKGTRVRLSGELDADVSRASARFEDGRAVPVALSSARGVALEFDAYVPGRLGLFFEGEDFPAASAPLGPQVPGAPRPAAAAPAVVLALDVTDDARPTIEILAPAQDLLVAPEEALRLTFQVSDDFGLTEVSLSHQLNNGPYKRETVLTFPSGERDGVFDHVWMLARLNLKPGDVARYFLTARDNNTLTGPGEAVSATFVVQVASYEAEHGAIEAALDDFRKNLTKLMGDESLLREKLDAPPKNQEEWNSLAREQAALSQRLANQASNLDKILERMESDPLTDQVTAAEHQAIRENLAQLQKDAVPRAQAALGAQQQKPAGEAMDEIVSELERMSLLSEDVRQAQNMRDMLMKQEEATELAESLAESLGEKQGKALSPEEQRKLQETLNEVAKLMQDVLDQLQKMPQQLPEDFVNQEAIKRLPLDQIAESMQAMQKAMQSGDAGAALAQAQKMLQQLKEMQKTLQKSAEGQTGGPSWFGAGLPQQVTELQKKLEALVERQEKLKAESQIVADKAVAKRVEKQKGELGRLAQTLAPLSEAAGRLQSGMAATGDAHLVIESQTRLPRVRAALDNVRQEAQALQLQNAPKNFEEILSLLDGLFDVMPDVRRRHLQSFDAAASTAAPPAGLSDAAKKSYAALEAVEKNTAALREGVAKAAALLAEGPADKEFLESADKEALSRQSKDQDVLEKDTRAFRKDVQTLARKTAVLGTALARRLQLAADAMGEAAKQLADFEVRPAVESQETALRYLRESQDDMNSASQSMSSMGQSVGKPMAGSAQPMPGSQQGGAGGRSGSRLGAVRIPRAEDYRPPKEFREEVLKSMKEKYPKSYEELIRKYYEKWAK